VHPDAQHTNARQSNKSLLLSRNAEMDARPQLEIYADDVKCAHGATVGQLDRDALYYLRARGVGEADARRLLIHAFVGDVLARIPLQPLHQALERLLWARLDRQEAAGK
jgi:Fe-S cluster assembly protein SufD